MTKAAIALDGNVISEHFGKVGEFLFVTFRTVETDCGHGSDHDCGK